MITGTLNKMEASRLFESEAVMVENKDVIPAARAIALFGEEAAAYAHEYGSDKNEYWLGSKDKRLKYFYRSGFNKIVTYHNIMTLREENEGNADNK